MGSATALETNVKLINELDLLPNATEFQRLVLPSIQGTTCKRERV